MRIRWLLAGAVVAVALAGSSFLLRASVLPEPVVQPIAFNHAAHVKGEEMACTDCHVGAKEQKAGFSDIRSCNECHKEPQGEKDTAIQRAVREYGNARREIPWIQVNRNPGHVYFSHRAHVTFGGMTCESCHGDMGSRTVPIDAPDKSLSSMQRCISCHRERGASLQCASCHD
jgi:hypothetical protein